jgi:hypothetical protein
VLTSHKSKNLYQLLIDDVDPNQLADHLSHRLTKQDVVSVSTGYKACACLV